MEMEHCGCVVFTEIIGHYSLSQQQCDYETEHIMKVLLS